MKKHWPVQSSPWSLCPSMPWGIKSLGKACRSLTHIPDYPLSPVHYTPGDILRSLLGFTSLKYILPLTLPLTLLSAQRLWVKRFIFFHFKSSCESHGPIVSYCDRAPLRKCITAFSALDYFFLQNCTDCHPHSSKHEARVTSLQHSTLRYRLQEMSWCGATAFKQFINESGIISYIEVRV